MQRLDTGAKPRPSPFTVWFGSFDGWVEREVLPAIQSGALDADDMIVLVAVLRAWDAAGVWAVAYAR